MVDYKGSAKIVGEEEGIKEQINEDGSTRNSDQERPQKNYKSISENMNKGVCFT